MPSPRARYKKTRPDGIHWRIRFDGGAYARSSTGFDPKKPQSLRSFQWTEDGKPGIVFRETIARSKRSSCPRFEVRQISIGRGDPPDGFLERSIYALLNSAFLARDGDRVNLNLRMQRWRSFA